MKKLSVLSYFLFLISYSSFSQNVGIGTNTPDASALLDVSATNKGILIPRLTDVQMNAIASPANGLLVYNTDSACFAYHSTTKWVFLKNNNTTNNGWNTNGNAGIDTSQNFMGTTDDNDIIFKRNNTIAGRINESQYSTSFGVGALNNIESPAGFNTAIGYQALTSNNTGGTNTAIGSLSLISNTSGSENVSMGAESMRSNTNGGSNTAIGALSLAANNAGNENTSVGRYSLLNNIGGSRNIAIGSFAGSANEGGSGNVYIGYDAGGDETDVSNRLYINNEHSGSKSLIYGEFDNKLLRLNGNVGIGTTPQGLLHISNANTDENASQLIIEGNSDFGDATYAAIEFRNNDVSLASGPAGRIKVFPSLTGNAITFQTTGPGPGFVDAMTLTNGNVGIGKTPETASNDSRLQVKQQGIQNGIGVESADNSNHWDLFVTGASVSDFQLYYNGALKGTFDNVTGAYTANSDRRLKKDVTPQQAVLNNVMQLQAYQYHYLDNRPADRFSNGFMAQDVQKLFPDAVVENEMKDGEKRLGINYQYFTVLAIKGLQEQQQKIQLQDNKIQSQEERIAKLEALVKTITEKK
ncbi:MAG: tail fiber domain-containing protein [Bacteroidota bacterium]